MVARVSPPPNPATQAPVALPKLVNDPVWSLRQWPVVVDLGGDEYTIPAMPAADWLAVMMDPGMTPDDVFPGLLSSAEQSHISQQLHLGELDFFEVEELGLEVLSTVTGRPWWVAMRLVSMAVGYWETLGGELAAVDAGRVSVAAWLDVLLPVILERMEPDKRTMFLMKLQQIPQGWEDEVEELEMSPESFMAMASQ